MQPEADDQVLAAVRDTIAEQFHVPAETVTEDTIASRVPGWDSLSHTLLLLRIEDRFGIELPADEVFDLANVGDLAGLVARVLAAENKPR